MTGADIYKVTSFIYAAESGISTFNFLCLLNIRFFKLVISNSFVLPAESVQPAFLFPFSFITEIKSLYLQMTTKFSAPKGVKWIKDYKEIKL